MIVTDPDRFAVMILTYKRSTKQHTWKTLRRLGYTGLIVFIVSSDDPTVNQLVTTVEDDPTHKVVQFDKTELLPHVDMMDGLDGTSASVLPRNAVWAIADHLGLEQFAILDDDYHGIGVRPIGVEHHNVTITTVKGSLNEVLDAYAKYQQDTNIEALGMCQGGDTIGGYDPTVSRYQTAIRKSMNLVFHRTNNPIRYRGRLNEDVNAYVWGGGTGEIHMTPWNAQITPAPTQAVSGGVTDLYEKYGTYIKSFYSVMIHPAVVTISAFGVRAFRPHHQVRWRYTAAKILSDAHTKGTPVPRVPHPWTPAALANLEDLA